MKFTTQELQNVFPNHVGSAGSPIPIETVVTDSRKQATKGLFIPIVGERFDGHEFLKEAILNGAIATVWQKDKEVPAFIPSDFPLFFVENTTTALQDLANFYLRKVSPTVVGVTGSNGKTTTKDLLEAVLSKNYLTHKTEGNYNNHIGLPLTILAMKPDCEVIILEMGMNHFGEIELLSNLSKPDYAIITNIGESHMEQLGSREGIAKAKLEITSGLKREGSLIIDGDEPLLKRLNTFHNTVTCGFQKEHDYYIHSLSVKEEGVAFQLNEESDIYSLPLLGTYNAKNAVYAIAVGKMMGMKDEDIKKGLSDVTLTGMRLEKRNGKNGSLLINDAYNASPTSMKAAIQVAKTLPGYEKRVLVLGDMYELGTMEEQQHRGVASVISEPITHVIVIGEKGKWIGDELKKHHTGKLEISGFLEKEDAVPVIHSLLSDKTLVLFKASRGMKLETIMEKLED